MSFTQGDSFYDQAFIRLPYEYQVKCIAQFKNQRKQVEKQITEILKQIVDPKRIQMSQEELQQLLEYLIELLRKLKEKVEMNYQDLSDTLQSIKKRIQYVQDQLKPSQSENDVSCQHQLKFQMLIIDMLLRMGYFKTASQMIKDCKLQDFMRQEQQIITEAFQILQDLKQHSTKEALNWCLANRTRLFKGGSQFEFQLIFQTFIELLRENKFTEALSYLQKQVQQVGNNFKSTDYLQKAMGCLFLQKQIQKFPHYEYYFQQNRWDDLIQRFKIELQNIYALSVEPPLQITLEAGLSTLKSIYCQMPEYKRPTICPLCSKIMDKLVAILPSTQKLESTWICRITGEIMDEHNPPMVLPNNQVYSQKALTEMANRFLGKVICPITKEEFNFSEATRVYLS